MSIFASRSTKVIVIPFDEGSQTVTIQKLAGRHLEQARQANQAAAIEALQRMGDEAFRRDVARLGDATKVATLVARQQADPLNGYDKTVLLTKGIKAWSYDEPVTPESIDDLDEDAADFLAREILKHTKPGLFAVDAEAAQKETDPSPSIA